ncbi:MAG: peptide MFS transporter [Flavobacteriales bacterium]|nr:peptide MFS transporter [Flavobacteriales bacterium]
MFKGHPKGLFVLSIANMGERFGYYTMLAIFVLFMQAKFGFSSDSTSTIFGTFLALVYFLPIFGGILADRVLGYSKTVILGITVMFAGYFVLAIPTGTDLTAKIMMFGALVLIAAGTGMFKGNLQALVGNLYDDPRYSSKRDLAYSIFYMCINVGAFFAPSAAEAISNYFLGKSGLTYDAQIPALAHQYLDNTITAEGLEKFSSIAEAQVAGASADLASFGQMYIEKLSESYNYGFGVACISLILSILVFVIFKKTYNYTDKQAVAKAAATPKTEEKGEKTAPAPGLAVELTKQQVKERMVALFFVFAIVIFFWMSFHQNGLTMTWFARDYTVSSVAGLDRFGFNLWSMLLFIVTFYGIVNLFQAKSAMQSVVSLIVAVVGGAGAYLAYSGLPETMSITPQKFQQFNPFFIIILTPVILAVFSSLAKRGKEPSAPRKIGIGMIIAAIGFMVLVFASTGLQAPKEIVATGGVSNQLVSVNWLIGCYFVLTVAELFLSPMGLSFVSRVAPPQYKGMMQGCWLGATAVGNYLVALIGYLWAGVNSLWVLWGVLVGCCLLSGIIMFVMMKKLEKATNAC